MYKRLTPINKVWRIIATGLGFALFGIGGLLVLAIVWFTLLRICIWNKYLRSKIAQCSISVCFKFFLWVIRLLKTIDYKFIGLEKLKDDKSCLVIANHPSLLDVVLLVSVMPRCDCMIKESLLDNLFIGGVIKTAGYIANTEASKMLPFCHQTLSDGGRILIFPEGTRSEPNEPIQLKRGAANIALRCQCDIRIIYIHCHPPMLIKNKKWYHAPPKKPQFTITVGEKINISDFTDENITVSARKLTRYLTLKFNSQRLNDIKDMKNTHGSTT